MSKICTVTQSRQHDVHDLHIIGRDFARNRQKHCAKFWCIISLPTFNALALLVGLQESLHPSCKNLLSWRLYIVNAAKPPVIREDHKTQVSVHCCISWLILWRDLCCIISCKLCYYTEVFPPVRFHCLCFFCTSRRAHKPGLTSTPW